MVVVAAILARDGRHEEMRLRSLKKGENQNCHASSEENGINRVNL